MLAAFCAFEWCRSPSLQLSTLHPTLGLVRPDSNIPDLSSQLLGAAYSRTPRALRQCMQCLTTGLAYSLLVRLVCHSFLATRCITHGPPGSAHCHSATCSSHPALASSPSRSTLQSRPTANSLWWPHLRSSSTCGHAVSCWVMCSASMLHRIFVCKQWHTWNQEHTQHCAGNAKRQVAVAFQPHRTCGDGPHHQRYTLHLGPQSTHHPMAHPPAQRGTSCTPHYYTRHQATHAPSAIGVTLHPIATHVRSSGAAGAAVSHSRTVMS